VYIDQFDLAQAEIVLVVLLLSEGHGYIIWRLKEGSVPYEGLIKLKNTRFLLSA
jgi:hypothetical protein